MWGWTKENSAIYFICVEWNSSNSACREIFQRKSFQMHQCSFSFRGFICSPQMFFFFSVLFFPCCFALSYGSLSSLPPPSSHTTSDSNLFSCSTEDETNWFGCVTLENHRHSFGFTVVKTIFVDSYWVTFIALSLPHTSRSPHLFLDCSQNTSCVRCSPISCKVLNHNPSQTGESYSLLGYKTMSCWEHLHFGLKH